MDVRRGDIYMADLSSHHVDFACGVRPVLIVQNDKGNAHSTSYIAAMVTSKPKKKMPTHILLSSQCGLRKNSTVLCEHLVTIRKEMLLEYVGTVINTEDETKIDRALEVSLQLNKSNRK